MTNPHVTFEHGMRAARLNWETDPRVTPALTAILHDQANALPVTFDSGPFGFDAHHIGDCPEAVVVRVENSDYPDDDGCRINRLRAWVRCPHRETETWADYAEYGELARLLAFIESRSWPIGPWLTASDPEPAPDRSVITKDGRTWIRFGDQMQDGAANWEPWEDESAPTATWAKVAGNYGPVRLLIDEGPLRGEVDGGR